MINGDKREIADGVMLNVYPDSCGGNLGNLIKLLKKKDMQDLFSYIYILPSMFRSDLDRGFSVISYDIEDSLVRNKDLKALQNMGISLKLDFVLNHLSVQSPQFRDLLDKGDESSYVDFFIDWNKFWEGHGEYSPQGYIIPNDEYLQKLFMRKPGLPILKIPFPDGSYRFYWNTFYQKISYIMPQKDDLLTIPGIDISNLDSLYSLIEKAYRNSTPWEDIAWESFTPLKQGILKFLNISCTEYLGQMDLNARSEAVWSFYKETFRKLKDYGASIVRLDAFAYLHKQIGMSNFFNSPGTWDHLDRIQSMADEHNITLLPEIHSTYEEGIHEKLAEKGYPIYDFFFPALLIDAIEKMDGTRLVSWINEIVRRGFKTVNMLGCHDGIPVLDIKGYLQELEIEEMIDLIKSRGGRVKGLYGPDGSKISYYQVNAAYFSALNGIPQKMLLARAVQIFMPGIPEVWYLDLFGGKNDYAAADTIGHKDINRTNLSMAEVESLLKTDLVKKQISLLKFRNTFPAFGFDSNCQTEITRERILQIRWEKEGSIAVFKTDLKDYSYEILYGKKGKSLKVLD